MKNDPDGRRSEGCLDSLDELLQSAQWPEDEADPLDKLLAAARWPEESADPLNTLLRVAKWPESASPASPSARTTPRWPRFRRGNRTRTWAVVAVTVAVACVALTFWSIRAPLENPSADNPSKTGLLRQSLAQADPSVAQQALPPGELYLRMLAARGASLDWAGNKSLDRILARRIAEPDGDLQQLTEPLLADHENVERRLLERFDALTGEQEGAVIELLGCVGSEASVPLMLQACRKPALHARAVQTLLKIADSPTLARLVLRECDPGLAEEITLELRARGDEQTFFPVLVARGEPSCIESHSDAWPRLQSL